MMDATPPMIIEIQKTEKHDVRDEVVEIVARLLCRADGKNPDEDVRISGSTMLSVKLPYPMNMRWYGYRDVAEKRLKELFKP